MKTYEVVDLTGDSYINPDWPGHHRNVGTITSISIHHDAAVRPHDYDSVARIKQETAEHYQRLGPGLAYHFVIDNVGTIFKTRPFELWTFVVGSDENPTTLAIKLDGYLHPPHNQKPTREQYEALGQLLIDLCEHHPEFPATYPNVRPHRDFSSTACLPLDETELLTPDGWVGLGDITTDHKVAQWADGAMSFANPTRIIEPYEAEVSKVRWLEATADHEIVSRLQKQTEYTKKPFSEVFGTSSAHYIPSGGQLEADGLPLTDDEIRVLIWIQGDGYYRKETRSNRVKNGKTYSGWSSSDYGIEWHLKKMRKITRITGLLESLGWDFRTQLKGDGSAAVIAYGGERIRWAEQYLVDKRFSWEWLNISQAQFEIFREELLEVDGCRANNSYSSSDAQNIDVVQAVFATHDGRANQWKSDPDRLGFSDQPLTLALGATKRTTTVGCVTVPDGNILIRQRGRTMVVGNCPGDLLAPWVLAIQSKADVLNVPIDAVYDWPELQPKQTQPPVVVPPPVPAPSLPALTQDKTFKPAAYVSQVKTHLDGLETGKRYADYEPGVKFDFVARFFKGDLAWLLTPYAITIHEQGKRELAGVPEKDVLLAQVPGSQPTPPSPVDPSQPPPVVPNPPNPSAEDQSHEKRISALEALVQKIIDFLNSIFKTGVRKE